MSSKITKTLMKASMLLPAAGLLMGNTSCEQKQAGRTLKRIVDVAQIQAPPLQIAPGTNFDFRYVMNQQAYGVFMESGGFALRYNPPLTVTSSGGQLTLTSNDQKMFNAAVAQSSNEPFVNWSKEASCMVYLPQAKVYGSVNSFEAVGGGGLQIGFNPTAGTLPGLQAASIGFNLEYAQLDMTLTATSPMKSADGTYRVMSSVNVDTKRTKMNFNLGIDFGMIHVGPSFWYSTPLASVTKNALTLAASSLKDDLDEKKEDWYTRVLARHDNELSIIGGRSMGFEIGDQLAIYNETYYWDGAPCASNYRGGSGTGVAPVAIAEVTSIGDEISLVKIVKQTDENAVVGAKVMLYQFAEPKKEESAKPPKTDTMTTVGSSN